MAKQYAERDAMALDEAGGYYMRHVMAMTGEKLHGKGDIAAELGWRDMQIDALQQKLDAVLAENVALKKCCEPTDEELKLLRDGDYNAEELWGVGGKKSCPKCAGRKTPATEAILNEVRAEGVEMWIHQLNGVTGWTVRNAKAFAAQLRAGSTEGGV